LFVVRFITWRGVSPQSLLKLSKKGCEPQLSARTLCQPVEYWQPAGVAQICESISRGDHERKVALANRPLDLCGNQWENTWIVFADGS